MSDSVNFKVLDIKYLELLVAAVESRIPVLVSAETTTGPPPAPLEISEKSLEYSSGYLRQDLSLSRLRTTF